MANAHFESVLRVGDGKRNRVDGGGGGCYNAFIMFQSKSQLGASRIIVVIKLNRRTMQILAGG